jgi:hypothetical protein
MRSTVRTLAFVLLPLAMACTTTDDGDGNGAEAAVVDAAPAVVEAIIASPAAGDTVDATFTMTLDVRNLELRPAGTMEPGTGHHHLTIDRDIVAEGEQMPAEAGIVHLGAAQTEYTWEGLAPGAHTIVAVLGDYEHKRLAGAKTDTVTVVVR